MSTETKIKRNRRSSSLLKRPSKSLVDSYLKLFRDDQRYYLGDQAIIDLFKKYPHNTRLEDILLKISVINDLYSTNILGTFEMARHIFSLNVDQHLIAKSTDIVDLIAAASFAPCRFYSFATKYCSWHDQENYPIYDSFVEKVLLAYRSQDDFHVFDRPDLRRYGAYKKILEAFRQAYELQAYSFKELDKFLWMMGKQAFPTRKVN